jgi:hypothetical protein
MGAYDNPKLIQPVNVGEIWARSSANVLDAFNSYLQDDAKKKAAAKKLISESEERIANFGEKVETAKEGSLFASVQGTSEEMTKAYADLEMKKLKGELSSKDYAVGTQGLFGKVNELRNFNANFDEFEKLFQETENISAYQEEGAATLAALDAKKKGKFNLRIEDGQWVAQFEDPMGNTRDFNPNNLNEAKNLMINEKLDAGADVQAGSDLINKLKTKTGNSYTYKDDSGSYSEKQVEQWADPRFLNEDGSTNKEELVKYLKTNTASPIADINMMEAGSYIVDSKLRAGVTLAKDGKIQDLIFQSELDKSGYPQEVKDEIIKTAELGGYRRYVYVNGEKIDTSGFAIAYAKEAMARDAVAQAGDLAQKSVSKTVDKTTDAADRARSASDKETIDLTKQTYEKLFTATYKAEAAGGDTKALGNLLLGVDIPGVGKVAPDLTEEGIVYNAKDNTLQLPIKEGDDIIMRTIDLKDEGEEKIVNAILKRRGVKNIGKASASLPGIIGELDPNNERFMDENPNPEDFN